MHIECQWFLEEVLTRIPWAIDGKTLDIGSRRFNNQWMPRALFSDYTGLDNSEGENVDIVQNSHELSFDSATFDCVLSLNVLEHDGKPDETMAEALRVLKHGGLFIMSAAGPLYKPHDVQSAGVPPGHYKNITEEQVKEWVEGMFFKRVTTNKAGDICCVGIK